VDGDVVESDGAERVRLGAAGAGGLERELDRELAERARASVEVGLAEVVLGVGGEPLVCALGTEVVCV
jgi:hypothetical protein